jgi:hypothetical protein
MGKKQQEPKRVQRRGQTGNGNAGTRLKRGLRWAFDTRYPEKDSSRLNWMKGRESESESVPESRFMQARADRSYNTRRDGESLVKRLTRTQHRWKV